jgi:hypothetical protein
MDFGPYSNRSVESNSFCTDGDLWFVNDADRGLCSGRKAAGSGEWDYKACYNDEKFHEMTMFCHKGSLLVRCTKFKDAAFVLFDKESLKPDEGTKPYVTAADSEGQLAWTESDYSPGTNEEKGNRHTRGLSFFSDGELIYTMVQYRSSSCSSSIVRSCLEIYELNGHQLTRV